MAAATVIVPSQSPAAGRLDRLLESLAAQTLEHETIVIDNDSPGRAVTAVILLGVKGRGRGQGPPGAID